MVSDGRMSAKNALGTGYRPGNIFTGQIFRFPVLNSGNLQKAENRSKHMNITEKAAQ